MLTGNVWYDVLMLLVTVWCGVHLVVRERYRYFKKKGIPVDGEPRFPFGNCMDALVLRRSLAEVADDIYRVGSDRSLVGFYLGLLPALLVRDPALVNTILVKEFNHFHDRDFDVDVETNPLDNNLFSSKGTKWRTLRKKCSPAFSSAKLRQAFLLIEAGVDRFIGAYLAKNTNVEIETKDAYCQLTTDVTGLCFFGLDLNTLDNPECGFRRLGHIVFNPSKTFAVKSFLRVLFPSIFLLLKVKTTEEFVEKFMLEFTKNTFEQRLKETIETESKRNDFVQMLLDLREKGEVDMDPFERSKEEILENILDQHQLNDDGKLVINDELLAAQLKYQDIQEKARDEVKKSVKKYGGFTYEAIAEMHYLEACIKEAMRIYPPFPLIARSCTKNYSLDDSLVIEEGSTLFFSILSIQNDPQFYPEPDKFIPERFLNSTPMPGTYLPFGYGPRICIGQRFALLEMKLTLAKILDKYRIETCSKMDECEPMKFVPTTFIIQPIKGIWCKFKDL